MLSEPRKPVPDANVLAWFEHVDAAALYVSVLSIGEIRNGIERLRRRRDRRQADVVEDWLAQMKADFADRVLGISLRVAERWGVINAAQVRPTVDGLLAATAIEHDLTLVTRDHGTLAAAGVRLLDPWTAG